MSPPRARAGRAAAATSVTVGCRGSGTGRESGRELAGGVTYGLLVSRDGGQNFATVVQSAPPAVHAGVRIRGAPGERVVVATVCDGNGNCGIKRLGRFQAR